MSLLSELNITIPKAAQVAKRDGPLWKGPEDSSDIGGITFSMLNRFLACRERFRLYAIEGLRAIESLNFKMEYGNAWHICEEAFAARPQSNSNWQTELICYAKDLAKKHPLEFELVDKVYQLVKLQFPIYIKYWSQQKDVVNRQPLFQEQKFKVPYRLSSGRIVYLRGKWDSVDLIDKGIWLQENKTKSQIDSIALQRQLNFDLQTMLYLVALEQSRDISDSQADGWSWTNPVRGVRYNVIRRPLSGGKGTIVQKQATEGAKCTRCKGIGQLHNSRFQGICPNCGGVGRVNAQPGETKEDYYRRVSAYIEAEPDQYFARFKCDVSQEAIQEFRVQCLDPILDQLCEWYDFMKLVSQGINLWGPNNDGIHWRHPYGLYNTIDETGSSDIDEYLNTRSEAGLQRVDELFRELQ